MAIVKMRKVFLVGLEEEKAEILKALQEMGNVEIQDITDLSEDDSANDQNMHTDADTDILDVELKQKLSQVKFALEFLARFNKEKKSMFLPKPVVTMSELYEVMDRQSVLLDAANECRKLEDDLTALRSRRARLLNIIEQLSPWESLDIPLESILDTAKTRILPGTMGKSKVESFQNILDQNQEEVFFQIVGTVREDVCCVIIYHKDLEASVSEQLKEHGFNRVVFSDYTGTPKKIINQCKSDIDAIEAEEKRIAETTKKLNAHVDELRILHDGLNIELEKLRAMKRILNTGKAYLLKGWIPKRDEKQLVNRLSRITEALHIEFEDPKEDEMFPVALDNPTLVKPFEVVTSLYSTPHPKGLDPNVHMAPFYFVFFGIMMGDAGYGLILSIVAALMTMKLKPKGMANKLGWLISICGVSTFAWGFLTGSWFGDLGEKIGGYFGLKTVVIWFSPMEEPLLMLGVCFGLGLIHVFAGMGLKAYMNIREGLVWDAIFDQGLWFVLIIGLLLLATPMSQAGGIIAVIGTVGLVLTQGRHQKNIFKKFFSGLLSLYNITGIFSDVLSYSRLFALGLATGIIGMVINMLGAMMGNSWYGWIIALVVMVFGHILNILINVLGAFVHAARLQYIEYFSKFFEGGGHAFTPLACKTKFINLIK